MARIKGAKNRATVIMDEMIASGESPAKAKVKAKMQVAREKKVSNKATTKKTTKKKVTKKEKTPLPKVVAGYNTTTQNAWLKAKEGKSRKFAIRAFCLMCLGGSGTEVKACTAPECPLFQFRITG